MDPQALVAPWTTPSHRSLTGHIFVVGVYVFIFGALAYLTFLTNGGIPGQLLLVYMAALPFAIAIGTVVTIAQARERLATHHIVAACLTGALLCGLLGIWFAFPLQTIVSIALVVGTRYVPAMRFLQPPRLTDFSGATPVAKHAAVPTWVTVAGAVALLLGGIGLALIALISWMLRSGLGTIDFGR